MKRTIFYYDVGSDERKHHVDFIYEPNKDGEVAFPNNGQSRHLITKVWDEFTDNKDVQERHIFTRPIVDEDGLEIPM